MKGVNVGGRDSGDGDAHARAQQDSQEESKKESKKKVELVETIQFYIVYKKIPPSTCTRTVKRVRR